MLEEGRNQSPFTSGVHWCIWISPTAEMFGQMGHFHVLQSHFFLFFFSYRCWDFISLLSDIFLALFCLFLLPGGRVLKVNAETKASVMGLLSALINIQSAGPETEMWILLWCPVWFTPQSFLLHVLESALFQATLFRDFHVLVCLFNSWGPVLWILMKADLCKTFSRVFVFAHRLNRPFRSIWIHSGLMICSAN